MVYRLDSKTFASSKECDTPILVLGSEISLHMRINITHDLYTFYPHFEDHFFVFKEGSKYLLFVCTRVVLVPTSVKLHMGRSPLCIPSN